MKPFTLPVLAFAVLLAGCGEDDPVPSKKPTPTPPAKVQAGSAEEAEVDRFADEILLDEDLPDPDDDGLTDDEIDALVDDLMLEP